MAGHAGAGPAWSMGGDNGSLFNKILSTDLDVDVSLVLQIVCTKLVGLGSSECIGRLDKHPKHHTAMK